jgi:hypothetical protein
MKSMLPLLGLLIFLMPHQLLIAQETEEIAMIRYSPEFKFKDGLYLNIEDVKTNDPIPLARIVTDLGSYSKEFVDEMYNSEKIILYDDYGIQRFIYTKHIWGYAEDGRLFIMAGGQFMRIIIQGSISLFIASATTHEKKTFQPRDTNMYSTTTEDLYRSHNKKYYYANVTGESKEYLFDFDSNTLAAYTVDVFEKLLVRDALLFTEYASLRKRDRKIRIGEFIRRYNTTHPLYFPAN